MEDMLKQLFIELKRLNDTINDIDERLKKLEYCRRAEVESNKIIETTNTPICDDLEYIWEKALDIIEKELSKVSFETWLKIIKPLSIDEDIICLEVESEFEKSIIECRYFELIRTALKSITNRDIGIELSVIECQKKIPTSREEIIHSINPMYTFDTFVAGENNESAYKHVLEIALNPYNHRKLVYIYGDVGTGKTHLLQAAANYISEHHNDAKVQYLSIETFVNKMIESIRNDNSLGFREELLSYDILLIDNLQFIAGKDMTQMEFIRIVSELLERGRQVIIASSQPPQDITMMNERFTSRFELGGFFEIKQPDLSTRVEILRRRRDEGNFKLSDEAIRIIADKTKDNVRELLNAFNRFIVTCKL